MNSTVRGMEHIGVTVPDIEEASAFFDKALGAVVCYDVLTPDKESQRGPQAEKKLQLPNGAEVNHIRMLRIGNSVNVELFHIMSEERHNPANLADFGMTHAAFYVDDLDKAIKQFTEAGGSTLSEPFPLPGVESGANNKTVYARTPWGMLVELITYPDGINYPDAKTTERWTPERK